MTEDASLWWYGRNGAQPDLQAGSYMLWGNVEIWGLGEEGWWWGGETIQTKKPVSVHTEWAACVISVTSVMTEKAL